MTEFELRIVEEDKVCFMDHSRQSLVPNANIFYCSCPVEDTTASNMKRVRCVLE